MHGAGDMPAEFIRRLATYVDDDQAGLPQALLESCSINKQRVFHVVLFWFERSAINYQPSAPALQLNPSG